MGSDFRSQKIVKVFKFFDLKNSNFLDKKDFEISAQNIAKQRGWQPEDAKYKDIEDSMLNVWNGLRKHADKDYDGRVSLEEWVSMWDAFAKNPSSPLEWQRLYCKVNFNSQDTGGDGVIDVDEHAGLMQAFGVDKESSLTLFKKLAKGKSIISLEDYQELWKEFFTSNDPNAPGNYIFGP